jgi:hypothetical protein
MNAARTPRLLFHYTSASGLIGIFDTKSIWATRIQYLNDFSEFKHAQELTIEAIRSHIKLNDLSKKHFICMAVGEYISRLDPYLYISCFSEEQDLLSQWRSYCPPNLGYSLSFETSTLIELATAQNYILKPCLYDIDIQKDIINSYVNTLLDDFIQRMPEQHDATQFTQENMNPYVSMFLDFAPYFKNPAFQEEREWRLVTKMPPNESDTKLRVGKSCLIPYKQFHLPLNTSTHPIYNIIVGPTPDMELASNSIQYLVRNTPKSISWRNSQIPYRNL